MTALGGLFICGVAYWVLSDTLTMTAYYPSPYGVYGELVSTKQTILARDGGNVGIGTTSPLVQLDVNGGMGLGTLPPAACGVSGEIAMVSNQPQWCDGRQWNVLGANACACPKGQQVTEPGANPSCPAGGFPINYDWASKLCNFSCGSCTTPDGWSPSPPTCSVSCGTCTADTLRAVTCQC